MKDSFFWISWVLHCITHKTFLQDFCVYLLPRTSCDMILCPQNFSVPSHPAALLQIATHFSGIDRTAPLQSYTRLPLYPFSFHRIRSDSRVCRFPSGIGRSYVVITALISRAFVLCSVQSSGKQIRRSSLEVGSNRGYAPCGNSQVVHQTDSVDQLVHMNPFTIINFSSSAPISDYLFFRFMPFSSVALRSDSSVFISLHLCKL